MNAMRLARHVLPLAMSALLLTVGWACTRHATGPVLSFCEIETGTAIAPFEDANLEAAVRDQLSVGPLEDLTCDLGALVNLTALKLHDNPDLSDIRPLLENEGLGAGDSVWLTGTSVSCSDMAELGAKGVTVLSDCP